MSEGTNHEKEQLKGMIQNMKEKLMQTAVEHELEVSRMKEEMGVFEAKAHQTNQLEEALDIYKEKF